MGANKSTSLDNQRIAEIATEVNGQFSKDYSAAFKQAIINKIKNAYTITQDHSTNKEKKLLTAGIPSQFIKCGFMTKIGGNVKNWKKRYFVAKNRADNYVIIYYEDETMNNEKGRVYCCGYKVQAFNADEMNWYGSNGIKLTSVDEEKRQWLFRAPTENEQMEWMEVFLNACKKSQPEPIKEDIYQHAFYSAYQLTRAAYGYFGNIIIFGNEIEMLESLTYCILKREIIDDTLELSYNNNKKKNNNQMKAIALAIHLDTKKIVKPIVFSTWKTIIDATNAMKSSYELTIKASLRLLFDTENLIKIFLNDKINLLVDSYINEYQMIICEPLLNSCFHDIILSYQKAIHSFYNEIYKILTTVDTNIDAILGAIKTTERIIDGTVGSIGPLANSHRILWTMHTDHLVSLQELFEFAGMRGYDVYSSVMDDLRILLRNGIYSFIKICFPFDYNKIISSSSSIITTTTTIAMKGNKNDDDEDDVKYLRDFIIQSIDTKERIKMESLQEQNIETLESNEINTDEVIKSTSRTTSNATDRTRSRKSSANKLRSQAQRIDINFLIQVLQEVTILLSHDAKFSLDNTMTNILIDAMESHVQETIIAQSYDVVLNAEKFINNDTKQLINLEAIGEQMVRDAVKKFAKRLTAERISEKEHMLEFDVTTLTKTDESQLPLQLS